MKSQGTRRLLGEAELHMPALHAIRSQCVQGGINLTRAGAIAHPCLPAMMYELWLLPAAQPGLPLLPPSQPLWTKPRGSAHEQPVSWTSMWLRCHCRSLPEATTRTTTCAGTTQDNNMLGVNNREALLRSCQLPEGIGKATCLTVPCKLTVHLLPLGHLGS
jgi:hypothetical protein